MEKKKIKFLKRLKKEAFTKAIGRYAQDHKIILRRRRKIRSPGEREGKFALVQVLLGKIVAVDVDNTKK
ncbi:hypothetical protein RUM43_001900 [Polyplax serrata]|uniref:Uncharacterized protein n=1 Tax=Polyplax serrata TaxID=468196 RepID=A0AAN8SKG4_POLSC